MQNIKYYVIWHGPSITELSGVLHRFSHLQETSVTRCAHTFQLICSSHFASQRQSEEIKRKKNPITPELIKKILIAVSSQ